MRLILTILIVLACLPVPGRAETCTWVPPKAEPKLEVFEGRATFSWPLDSKWFRCVRKDKKSKLKVTYLLGGKSGELTVAREFDRRSGTAKESIYRSGFCKREPLPHRVQVKVTGTGAFERLAHETAVKPIHCDRCVRRSYEESMAIHPSGFLTTKGHVTIIGAYDKAFRTCAVAEPDEAATLEMRVYLGRSATEARKRTDHSFVVRGLEQSEKFKKPLPMKELCAGGAKWIGVELFGTGEFAQMNGAGRSVSAFTCR